MMYFTLCITLSKMMEKAFKTETDRHCTEKVSDFLEKAGCYLKLKNKIDYKKAAIPFLVGAALWFLPIRPDAVDMEAWHMFAIFFATIIGCIVKPFPIGATAVIGLTAALATQTVSMDDALQGFSASSIWLIVMAFFISRGFIKTGLGSRLAYYFVKRFGKKTLGLAYAIIGCDLIVAPATPSNTARAGGIVYPVVKSLAESFGSKPEDGTERKIGSFLMFSEFHGDMITAAMFMTAMAANPLAQTLAAAQGVSISWFDWFLAALVPGVISLLLVPLIIYKIYPPEIKATPDAPAWADAQLMKMGPIGRDEKKMLVIFVLALLLWVTGTVTGISDVLTAFIALSLLLLTGVLEWNDVKKEQGAWDTLIWFSILVMMANELSAYGFISWLSGLIGNSVNGLPWPAVLVILILAYFYSHYLFASATAHVSAMYSAFLGVALASGVPPLLAALMLGFFGNLFASTTHYSNGPAPVLFGAGYVSQGKWWSMNFVLGIFYLVVWLLIGSLWMKAICMY